MNELQELQKKLAELEREAARLVGVSVQKPGI